MHKSYIAVENTEGKGEIACNKQFLLFSQCFLPNIVIIFHFKCTLKCRLQFVSVWTNQKCCRLTMEYTRPSLHYFYSFEFKSFLSHLFLFRHFSFPTILKKIIGKTPKIRLTFHLDLKSAVDSNLVLLC